ncbi:MAG: hypothetical protein R6X25_00360, partial [Candidatus Krumholzibacteriia bacterium]
TIAYSKRRQMSAERMAILLVWRNYMKWRSENSPAETPAMAIGAKSERVDLDEILSHRLFRSHVQLPPRWAAYYEQQVVTRALPRNRVHDLKYAF